MVDEAWTTSYCLNTPGFPKLLYATMTKLGILDHPEYVGKEYEEYGTERCDVIVFVKTRNFLIQYHGWCLPQVFALRTLTKLQLVRL
jgi:hypothetical protein